MLLACGYEVKLCFVFDENEHLIDFIWRIKTFKVLSELKECTEKDQECIFIHTINLIQD